ncbi:MAG: family 20 glycosylhydrolase, partial [Ginsengibacter sp.]
MMFRKIALLFLVFLPCGLQAQQMVSIIPQPVSIENKEGTFIINEKTGVNFNRTNKDLVAAAGFLTSYIKNISGYNLPLHTTNAPEIELSIQKVNDVGEEGYILSVSPRSIKIIANSKIGIVYGLQSLFQTLPPVRNNSPLIVPCMEIKDYPRFKWRGMHLDVSRHFFPPQMVKEYIDLMGTYKLNRFHWHLTDDQGWRIEIKKYPKLTSVGAWRVDRTDEPWELREPARKGEPATYGGFYTQQQVKEIVAYAKERNIIIVPEIEMPGHSEAAITAYPFLSCAQQQQMVITGGQYPKEFQTNFCAGNDSVFTFLENVLTEVMALFPSRYIHIGGDEVDKSSWKTCPRCQARMKANGLKDVDELQSYFIHRIEKFLNSKGRKIIGWDEILEGGLAPDATVMSWRGEAGGIKAAQMHHDVIMTPGNPLYFDQYQAGPEGEPLAIGGFNSLKKVYDYDPIPAQLTAEETKYVLGAQANLWAEFVATPSHLEYMVLPRMLALAEVDWTPKDSRNWNNFYQRLQYHFNAFDQKGYNYCKGNYTVAIKPESKDGKLEVHLSSEIPGTEIYYTTDGEMPNLTSHHYEGPVAVDSSIQLKAITVLKQKIMSTIPAIQKFTMHKAVGKDVHYVSKPSSYYMADGINSLTDGVRGTTAVNKYWHGFSGKDLVATIDLGE